MKKVVLLIFWLLLCIPSQAQIREIAAPNLPDIAIASMDQFGPVIYYNPSVCEQAGPLVTAFFRAHEYGHHNLGHIVGRITGDPYVQIWLDLTMETDADTYSIRYWIGRDRKDILQAAAQFFWISNNLGDRTHAPSRVRATNIANNYRSITNTSLFE